MPQRASSRAMRALLLSLCLCSARGRLLVFSSAEELDALAAADPEVPLVAGYFDLYADAKSMDAFRLVSRGEESRARFAATTNKALLQEQGREGCAVVVFLPGKYAQPQHEQTRTLYPSRSVRADALALFVRAKAVPLVGELWPRSQELYDAQTLPLLTLFCSDEDGEQVRGLMAELTEAAKALRGRMVLTVASALVQKQLLSNFRVGLSGRPDLVLGVRVGDAHYSLGVDRGVRAAQLLAFAEAVLDGRVDGHRVERHSEEGDFGYQGSDVLTLTHENFAEQVTYGSRHALLVFYAPWCGICKAMRPELMQAARTLSTMDAVLVGAMDAEMHGAPDGFPVNGYPTIYYLAPGSEEPEAYEGDRRAHSLVSYMKSKLDS